MANPDHEEESYWVQNALDEARQPQNWRWQACLLKRSADRLLRLVMEDFASLGKRDPSEDPTNTWPDPNTYMMLVGLALENLAKGIRVAQSPGDVLQEDPKGILRLSGDGHITPAMVEQTGVRLSPEERELLERLRAFVRWGGRYPVPKRPKDLKPAPTSNPMLRGPIAFSSDDVPAIDALWTRLLDLLDHIWPQWVGEEKAKLASEKRTRREETLAALRSSDFECLIDGGIRYFQRRSAVVSEIGTYAFACLSCGKCATLNENRPAAICACGTLHHVTPYFDWNLGRRALRSESYPIEQHHPVDAPSSEDT